MESGIVVDEQLHNHKLYCYENNEFLWYCDSLTNSQECKGNQKEVCSNYPCKKFACRDGCVDLFCESCVDYYQRPEMPIIEIKLKNHEHPLIFFEYLPIKWSCAYEENSKCKRNHKNPKEYRKHSAFACKKCQLYICDFDGLPFAKQDDLPRIKKSPTLIEKKVTFHEHPLRLSNENNGLWYCDSLLLDRTCESGQQQIMSDWGGKKKYICSNGCLDTFCELCVFKNMINEDENIKIKNPNHPHELKYYSNLPYEWCCEFGKNQNCLRNIEKTDYWTHNVYVCEQCKFHICDLDLEKEQMIAQKEPCFNEEGTIFNKSNIFIEEKNKLLKYDIKQPNLNTSEKDRKKEIEDKLKPIFGRDNLMKKYDFIRYVGAGKFGSVFAVKKKGEAKEYALKLVQITEENDLNDAKKEIENMEKIKNLNNILSFIDYQINDIKLKAEGSSTETKVYVIEILLELADGSLDDILEKYGSIKENVLIQMLRQLVNGLWEAFNRNCGHLDIKPQNILAFGNVLKLADWGGSIFAQTQASTTLDGFSFTVLYASPEVMKNAEEGKLPNSKKVTSRVNVFQADLYSVGLVMLKCCGVKIKGHSKNYEKQDEHDKALETLISDASQKGYSDNLLDIVRLMCVYDPKRRIDIRKLKELVQDL